MRLSSALTSHRRSGWASAVAAGALLAFPVSAGARVDHVGSRATSAAAAGTVFGGVSAQDFPVVIETSKNGRKVVNASIGIRLACTSGSTVTLPDGYRGMSVKKRRFGSSFGPTTNRNDDNTTTDFEGRISGAFNKARSKASGTWSFKATDHDASGAVTDTCDSKTVNWTVKQ